MQRQKYRHVLIDDGTMGLLRGLAKALGVSGSRLLRRLIRKAHKRWALKQVAKAPDDFHCVDYVKGAPNGECVGDGDTTCAECKWYMEPGTEANCGPH